MFLRKLFRFLNGRIFIIGLLLLIQLTVILTGILILNEHYVLVSSLTTLVSVVIVLILINNQEQNPSTKLVWIIVIMLLPIVGAAIYLMFGSRYASKKLRHKVLGENANSAGALPDHSEVVSALSKVDPAAAAQCRYILNTTQIPPFAAAECEYFTSGEALFPRLLDELRQARKYIFIESFIVQEGLFWDSILAVLKEKAAAGVDVRVMYDDIGCLKTLPLDYPQTLRKLGIKCTVFNPVKARLDTGINNRDHRKIIIIDGKKAVVGGINLADEYINHIERFGYWKDSALLFSGGAVSGMELMFLQSWNLYAPDMRLDYREYCRPVEETAEDYRHGFIQPLHDNPFDGEHIGESVFINMINAANRYIYINTPYFIVDNEMLTALQLAAKRGVDVRICTPHIPDKWYVHMMTQAYYQPLQKAGVKVSEFTPGFNHTKSIVADDKIAFVGTINCDYRSFYHHFECGALLYGVMDIITLMREDFLRTEAQCTPAEECTKLTPLRLKLLRSLLRLFAPLM